MSTDVLYFQKSADEQNLALSNRISGWLSLFGKRVDTVSSQVQFLTEDYRERQVLMIELRQQIVDCNDHIVNSENEKLLVLERIDELINELNESNDKYSSAKTEIDDLNAQIRDIERQMEADRASTHQSQILVSDDVLKLTERLENAEKRSMEVATHHAKLFANNSRGMAILESECYRLRSLVDYLRLVNAKLIGDVKFASGQVAIGKGHENRLKICLKELDNYRSQTLELQEENRNRNHTHLEALKETQDAEMQRLAEHEAEVAELVEQINTEKVKLIHVFLKLSSYLIFMFGIIHQNAKAGLVAELEQLQLLLAASNNRNEISLIEHSKAMHRTQTELSHTIERLENSESQVASLEKRLAAHDDKIEKTSLNHIVYSESIQKLLDEALLQSSALQRDLNDSKEKTRAAEILLDALKQKYSALESAVLEKDREMSIASSKLRGITDEMELKTSRLVIAQQELLTLTGVKEQALAEISQIREELSVTKTKLSDADMENSRATSTVVSCNAKIRYIHQLNSCLQF